MSLYSNPLDALMTRLTCVGFDSPTRARDAEIVRFSAPAAGRRKPKSYTPGIICSLVPDLERRLSSALVASPFAAERDPAGPLRHAGIPSGLGVSAGSLSATSAAIVSLHSRGVSGLDELILQVYQAPISLRDAYRLMDRLWGGNLPPGTLVELAQEVASRLRHWAERPLGGTFPFVYLAAVPLAKGIAPGSEHIQVVCAIGLTPQGSREVLAVTDGWAQDAGTWDRLLLGLRSRGVSRIDVVVANNANPISPALARHYPEARFHACICSFKENLLRLTSPKFIVDVEDRLRATLKEHSLDGIESLRKMLEEAGETDALMYIRHSLPHLQGGFEAPKQLRSRVACATWLHEALVDYRQSLRRIPACVTSEDAVLLACARLRHLSQSAWAKRSYFNPPQTEAVE